MQCQNVDKFSSYARLKSHFKNPAILFHQVLKHWKKVKALGQRPVAFITFLMCGTSMKNRNLTTDTQSITLVLIWASFTCVVKDVPEYGFEICLA